MSENSVHLNLPYILPSQAQKHVTHNAALDLLDVIVQLSVESVLQDPPSDPADGQRHIVAEGASGTWAGHDNEIACHMDGEWAFIAPRPGFMAVVLDTDQLVFWTGDAWRGLASTLTQLNDLTELGVGTAADSTNPFSAKLNKALWTARTAAESGTGDLRFTLNKEAHAHALSLLMQTGYSGRAEIGLSGSDDLSVKVSANGTDWTTALQVDRSTGLAKVAGDPSDGLGIATKQYVDTRPAGSITSAAVGSISATNVQAAIGQLESRMVARTGDTVSGTYSFGGPVNLNGGLAIGGGSPTYTRDGVAALFRFINYRDTNGSHATFVADVARGTQSAPAFMTATGLMFEVSVRPYDGSAVGIATSGRLAFRATENHGPTARGTSLTVELAPNGSATVQEVASFGADSGLSLFGANPVIDQNRHHRLRSYTVATLPGASPAGQLIRVSDGSSNRQLALSDGAAWRFADGNVVS